MYKSKGFSLIELMIVVAVIAVIASIAVPSYQDSVRKSRRAEGKALLLDAAQRQEQHFTQYNQYATGITADNPPTQMLLIATSENNHYNLAISNTGTNTFTFTVTPQAPHNDAQCGALTLTHLGVKGESGTGTVDECW